MGAYQSNGGYNIMKSEITYDWLYTQYIHLNKTVKEIAQEYNMSKDTIAHKLSDYKIKKEDYITKPSGDFENKGWLYQEYIVKNKTIKQIAQDKKGIQK